MLMKKNFLLGIACVSWGLVLPVVGHTATNWGDNPVVISADEILTNPTTATDAAHKVTINNGVTLTVKNTSLQAQSGNSPLEFTATGATLRVQGATAIEDRVDGRLLLKGGNLITEEGSSLTANRITVKDADFRVGGKVSTSGLGIDASRVSIPLVAFKGSDAPINLGYVGSGYSSTGNGELKLNSHQSGSNDLSSITINGLVQDATKANIGVEQSKNVYLITGINSITGGNGSIASTDLSGIKLTTDDVLFSMSGLTFSGSDLFVSVFRKSAQAAMPDLPSELRGLVDGYRPGSNNFMDAALKQGGEAGKSITSATYSASVSGGGATAVAASSQNTATIAARASGQAMSPGSMTASAASVDTLVGLSAGDAVQAGQWQQGFGIWASPVYVHDRGFGITVGDYTTGYNADTFGVVFGADYTFDNFRVGLAGNVGGGYAKSNGDLAKTDNNMNYGGVNVYGSWNINPLTLTANVGWMRTHNSLEQSNVAGSLSSDYDADLWSASLLAEYSLQAGSINIIPSVGLSYSYYDQKSFDTEMQGNAISNNGKVNMNIWNIPVGVRANTDFAVGNGSLTPEIRARWIPSIGDTHMKYDVRMPGSSGIANINSPMLDNHTGEVGGGLKYSIGDFSVSANYDFQFSEHRTSHGVYGVLRLEF